jgi:putative thioredoxin
MSVTIFDVGLDDFETLVLAASKQNPILVDFWAEWCPPCLAIAPILEKVVAEYDGEIKLARLEVDDGENMKLAGRYKVRGFPTIMLFKDGEALGQFSGARTQAFIENFIDELV